MLSVSNGPKLCFGKIQLEEFLRQFFDLNFDKNCETKFNLIRKEKKNLGRGIGLVGNKAITFTDYPVQNIKGIY